MPGTSGTHLQLQLLSALIAHDTMSGAPVTAPKREEQPRRPRRAAAEAAKQAIHRTQSAPRRSTSVGPDTAAAPANAPPEPGGEDDGEQAEEPEEPAGQEGCKSAGEAEGDPAEEGKEDEEAAEEPAAGGPSWACLTGAHPGLDAEKADGDYAGKAKESGEMRDSQRGRCTRASCGRGELGLLDGGGGPRAECSADCILRCR